MHPSLLLHTCLSGTLSGTDGLISGSYSSTSGTYLSTRVVWYSVWHFCSTMVLQAAGLPSEHSSTSTSRQTFTLVEDQHLKNGDVDLLAPGMLIPETKLWHTPTIGTQPQHPPIVLYTPLCPQNVPAKQSSLDQDNRRLVKIWRILHFLHEECMSTCWLQSLKSIYQPAGWYSSRWTSTCWLQSLLHSGSKKQLLPGSVRLSRVQPPTWDIIIRF